MRSYDAVFSRQALEFVAITDEDCFREVTEWLDRIERFPSAPGDYTERDDSRRQIQVVVLRYVAIAYWTDHASLEVRVIRVETNG